MCKIAFEVPLDLWRVLFWLVGRILGKKKERIIKEKIAILYLGSWVRKVEHHNLSVVVYD